jgi:hypothetical protein
VKEDEDTQSEGRKAVEVEVRKSEVIVLATKKEWVRRGSSPYQHRRTRQGRGRGRLFGGHC